MRIRGATPADAAGVAPLLTLLGYPVSPAEVAQRISAREGSAVDAAWVAVDGDAVVGFAAGHVFAPYELDAPVAELTALVVAGARRRGGAGRLLVAGFERWAADAGCVRVSVATAFHRADAHAFYEALGYEQHARKYEKNPGRDA